MCIFKGINDIKNLSKIQPKDEPPLPNNVSLSVMGHVVLSVGVTGFLFVYPMSKVDRLLECKGHAVSVSVYQE